MKYLLYSTQSALVYRLSRRYFGNRYYVYCCDAYASTNPASSSPQELYNLFRAIAERGDQGNPKVLSQKNTLKSVALMRLTSKQLSQQEYNDMVWEIEHAETRDFAPILFLIIRDIVKHKIKPVQISQRASMSSEEYIIEELEDHEFEMISTHLQLTGGV